ncbi:class I SAM-dependent methyltransferase [Cohnella cholangitidis]|uniref:Methyltransferase domain-containing protein n=1 Tax=Cohnella cholangitidis TaxID=2598458 RepID=A0A7G5BV81_9BACL|nr:methyltransferase domain-containing protein [Cohnella cholangitidis]QMV40865.1 methyltransferase domain-containing protein [Cohnella cholangitidis]
MRIISEEARLFLRKFVRKPKQIGSVVPSSRFLADSMVAPIPWHSVQSVAELGSGTGAITQAISRKALPDTKVYLFEKDSKMRKRLLRDYPDFKCAANAVNLSRILAQKNAPKLDCILSGLPFYNFPQPLRDVLMEQISASLKPGGLFVAFQYSMQMKNQMSSMFQIERIQFVPLNFPPAFVYVCRKEIRS